MKDKLIGNEKNILFYNEELNENSTCAKIAQVQNEGNRKVKRTLPYII